MDGWKSLTVDTANATKSVIVVIVIEPPTCFKACAILSGPWISGSISSTASTMINILSIPKR